MKERPILFNDSMVRAEQAGRKTQTRRVIDHLLGFGRGITEFSKSNTTGYDWHFRDRRQRWHDITHVQLLECCPYGQPGDRLWVREAWTPEPRGRGFNDQRVIYRADMLCMPRTMDYDAKMMLADPWLGPPNTLKWKPSTHMKRNASRILLEITSVRVERVQDISEDDARAEGVEPLESRDHEDREDFDHSLCQRCGGLRLHASLGANLGVIFDNDCQACTTHRDRFRHLWESTYGDNAWDRNDWVWVIEFKALSNGGER